MFSQGGTLLIQNVSTSAAQSHVIFQRVLSKVFSRLQRKLRFRADTFSFVRLVTFSHPRDKPMNISTSASQYFQIVLFKVFSRLQCPLELLVWSFTLEIRADAGKNQGRHSGLHVNPSFYCNVNVYITMNYHLPK